MRRENNLNSSADSREHSYSDGWPLTLCGTIYSFRSVSLKRSPVRRCRSNAKRESRLSDSTPDFPRNDCLTLLREHRSGARSLKNFSAIFQEAVKTLGVPLPLSCPALSLQRYGEELCAESIAACRAALELRPNYAEAWNNICAAYNKLGRYEEAAAACEQALRYKPDLELARNNLQYARKMAKAPAK